jgi:hypothetical protein
MNIKRYQSKPRANAYAVYPAGYLHPRNVASVVESQRSGRTKEAIQ